MNLQTLGFKEGYAANLVKFNEQPKYSKCIPARVTLEHKHSYRVISEDGEWLATVAGKYAYDSQTREDYPAVGDWVLVEKMPGEERAIIHELFPRFSKFSRKVAGEQIAEQIVASNVDLLFLVMSLNADFNVRRMERYLVAAWDSGATPVVILTKADLCSDVLGYVGQLENSVLGVDVHIVSAYTGEGIEDVKALLSEGVTGALLGSSGAGKSTLINAICESERMKVSDIREDDAKGRHTTTHRELVVLPSGGCLIDTPGMRELQLWDQSESVSSGFQDIALLAEQCYYRDCTHVKEPRCAVNQAVENGSLEEARLKSYFKLQKELAYIERKTNTQEKLAEQKKWKLLSKGGKRKNR